MLLTDKLPQNRTFPLRACDIPPIFSSDHMVALKKIEQALEDGYHLLNGVGSIQWSFDATKVPFSSFNSVVDYTND
jgi:hypothetical protein